MVIVVGVEFRGFESIVVFFLLYLGGEGRGELDKVE